MLFDCKIRPLGGSGGGNLPLRKPSACSGTSALGNVNRIELIDTRGMRTSQVVVLAVSLMLSATACGSQEPTTELRITVRIGAETHRFRLACAPPGGNVPNAKDVCSSLSAHRDAMLFPPALTGSCFGSVGIPPEVAVAGVSAGERIRFSVRACDAPPARVDAVNLWLASLGLGTPTAVALKLG